MAKAKGSNLDNLKSYVLERYGKDAYRLVLQALPPSDRGELEQLVAIGWYDSTMEPRLLRTIDAVLGAGDLALVEDMARYAAERDLGGVHRLFIRVANPGYLLTRCGEYWSRFYDTGRWQVVRHSPYAATGTLCGFEVKDGAFCLFLGTYIRRLFEMSGAKNASLQHARCRARGETECVFTGTWT